MLSCIVDTSPLEEGNFYLENRLERVETQISYCSISIVHPLLQVVQLSDVRHFMLGNELWRPRNLVEEA